MRPMTSHSPLRPRHGWTPTLSAIALTFVAACHGDPPPPAPPLPAVTVAPAKRAIVTPWSEFPGQFSSVQTVEVRPRVSGYIARVAFHEGAEVRAGDPLFLIDARPYAAALVGAQAHLGTRSSRGAAGEERSRSCRHIGRRARYGA